MKKLVLIFVLIIISINLFTQSFKFVDFKNRWKVDWYQSAIPFPEERIYFFNGDSVLVGNKYFQQLVYTSKFSPEPKLSDYEFRQEGSKLYSSYLSNEPYLIFDFDAEVGDTIFSKYEEFSSFDKIIEEIDTLTLNNGDKVKRYKVSCLEDGNENTLTWIEGIGDVILLFQPEVQCSLFDPQDHEELRCFGREGEVLFNIEDEIKCDKIEKPKFVDFDNLWYLSYFGFEPLYSYRRKFFEDEVKIVNGKTFYNMKTSYEETGEDNFNESAGYYREENNIVFQLVDSTEVEYMNFNLQTGETIIGYENVNYYVSDISFVQLKNGVLAKVIKFKCEEFENAEYEWIEGVGKKYFGYYCWIDGVDNFTNCYFYKDEFAYQSFENSGCWIVSNDDEIINKFSITPNPGNTSFKISSEKSINKINVKTLDGKLISTIYKSIEFDASSLKQGLYFVRAHFSDGSIGVEKWVKE